MLVCEVLIMKREKLHKCKHCGTASHCKICSTCKVKTELWATIQTMVRNKIEEARGNGVQKKG